MYYLKRRNDICQGLLLSVITCYKTNKYLYDQKETGDCHHCTETSQKKSQAFNWNVFQHQPLYILIKYFPWWMPMFVFFWQPSEPLTISRDDCRIVLKLGSLYRLLVNIFTRGERKNASKVFVFTLCNETEATMIWICWQNSICIDVFSNLHGWSTQFKQRVKTLTY